MTDRRDDHRHARNQSTEPSTSPDAEQLPASDATTGTGRRGRIAKPAAPKPTRAQTPLIPPADTGVTGIVGDASAEAGSSRSGEDTRKRGWYWHWNSIVTQYAPLIGLKGVGLLNSYTVWTDRREESPHRGYAFPSQQSEADFYGEDRAELITINKILVALDLIEIRKEMVLRVDAQGRRWKVPHNLYRVKDHGDDTSLTANDVMRVVELAAKDRAVYRYVRKIFSPRFSPIDGDNIWHQILPVVQATETWQQLATKTIRDETKASARSKAGHQARREQTDTPVFSLPSGGDNGTDVTTASDTGSDSDTVETGIGEIADTTSVARINTGSAIDVESTNTGSNDFGVSTVRVGNRGRSTSVAPSNTTYNQSHTTTTTEFTGISSSDVRTDRTVTQPSFSMQDVPDSRRSEQRALRIYEEANDRTATAAERRQLRQLAERTGTMGFSAVHDPWDLLSSAIEEAVAAGSSFVAPKRIREIVTRWAKDGVPSEYAPNVAPVTSGNGGVTDGSDASHSSVSDVSLPGERDANDVWMHVRHAVRPVIGANIADALFRETAIVGYDAGEVAISVPTAAQEVAFGEHAEIVQRKLGTALRRPVRLRIELRDGDPEGDDPEPERAPHPDAPSAEDRAEIRARRMALLEQVVATTASAEVPVFPIARGGMTNRQLWSLALNDLEAQGAVPRTDIDAWLRDSAILACEEMTGGAQLVLGVPHVLAARRVEGRFLHPIRQVLGRLMGLAGGPELAVVVTREWLRETA